MVCLTLWKSSSELEPDDDWTDMCGAIGTLFYLTANINFSLNMYGYVKSFDYIQVMTLSFYVLGQQLLTISTFDCKKCMKLELEEREAKKLR